jgi:hypothetical protein
VQFRRSTLLEKTTSKAAAQNEWKYASYCENTLIMSLITTMSFILITSSPESVIEQGGAAQDPERCRFMF